MHGYSLSIHLRLMSYSKRQWPMLASTMFRTIGTFYKNQLRLNIDSNTGFTFQPLLVSIEGNIGSGKSTLMNQLRGGRAEWIFIEEPVSLWSSLRNEDGNSLLQLFYKDRRCVYACGCRRMRLMYLWM